MGLVKEPQGVDLLVGPSRLTEDDQKLISKVITDYKLTGKMPAKAKRRKQKLINKTPA